MPQLGASRASSRSPEAFINANAPGVRGSNLGPIPPVYRSLRPFVRLLSENWRRASFLAGNRTRASLWGVILKKAPMLNRFDRMSYYRKRAGDFCEPYSSFAYSILACCKMGISESASFQSEKNS
jgi:hypothetical protein